jgi:hypothetical protein
MYFMNDKFGDLVGHAWLSVPDDLKFERSWPPTPTGFMWLEKPFDAGPYAGLIHAVSWIGGMLESGGYLFHFFSDHGDSYDVYPGRPLGQNDTLADLLARFEVGSYGLLMYPTLRWVFAAFHLMSQHLCVQVECDTDRATKRRAERSKTTVPPKFKVVTLRRMEIDRVNAERNGGKEPTDWRWQWAVRGHWRNQWHPAAQGHRQIFIEAYIKGPEDKPLKPVTKYIFVCEH